MTAPSADAIKQERKSKVPQSFFIRKVRPTTNRAGQPVLEIPLPSPGAGILLVEHDNKEALALLAEVGISVHDGGKFYIADKPMELDKDLYLDAQIEISPSPNGRKLSAVKSGKIDAGAVAGMTDAEFSAAWEKASKIVSSLKTVASDSAVWFPRVHRVITQFYAENGFGNGEWTANAIIQQAKAAKACGDVTYIQNRLKKHLREDFPEGASDLTKKFEREGCQADVALLISDENSNRHGKRYGSGKVLEIHILGEPVSLFVKSQSTYESAKGLVKQFFEDYDRETDLLQGTAAIESEHTDLSVDDFNRIREGVLKSNGATDTMDVVQSPEYDKSVILAAYRSAIEAFKHKDVPKFENGIKEQQSDADTLTALNKADIKDPDPVGEAADAKVMTEIASSPETEDINEMEQGMADPKNDPPPTSEPTSPPAPPVEKPASPPKPLTADGLAEPFTAEQWSKWLADQKQDYPELKPADIMQILEITRASEWMPRTLKDAAEKLKRAVEVRRADALLEDAKRILKDKNVPLEEWTKIIAEAGDPKLFADTSYSKTNYQGKILTLANAYSAAHNAPPKVESAMVPVNPNPPQAIVPTQPPSYSILTALKLPTPEEMQVMFQLAAPIAESRLFAGVDSAPRAIAIMLKALQWNIGAIDGFENFYVFPTQRGDVIYPSTKIVKARVIAHPKCKRFDVTGDDTKATAIVWREGDEAPVSFTYTIQEAETAGLLEKKNWKTNKSDMLKYRVSRRAIYEKFPDLALGFNDAEDAA